MSEDSPPTQTFKELAKSEGQVEGEENGEEHENGDQLANPAEAISEVKQKNEEREEEG